MRTPARSSVIVSLLLVLASTAGSERLPSMAPGAATAILADGQWLVTGGLGERGVTPAALLHDPRSGLSTPLPSGLRRARAWHSATVLADGRVAILGGLDAAGAPVMGDDGKPLMEPVEFASDSTIGRLVRRPWDAKTLNELTRYMLFRVPPAPISSVDFKLYVRPKYAHVFGLATTAQPPNPAVR